MFFFNHKSTYLQISLSMILLGCVLAKVYGQTQAKSLYDQTVNQVYQIRVIDIASGDKYSIGSGFSISATGHLATNFHVVSSFVHEPEKYRLEYIDANGQSGELSLLAIDVVHDLAIAHSQAISGAFLNVSNGELPKGERIYSMGNPYDLGMTIVEGNYNGVVENSRYKKILFSGTLNSGMSGGPALNESGEVIGINVSKGGEQISFLVPSNHLSNLMVGLTQRDAHNAEADFQADIRAALMADQQVFYDAILAIPIVNKQLGDLHIPDKLHASLKCWGHTQDKEENQYVAVHQHCKSEDEIYIKGGLHLGEFKYDIEFINTETLNRFQFYTLLEGRYKHRHFNNSYDKDDFKPFLCHDDLVELNSGSWKVSACFRAYQEYEGLYDSSMIMVSTNHANKAAVVKISSTGSSLHSAKAIFQTMMEAVTWVH